MKNMVLEYKYYFHKGRKIKKEIILYNVFHV
jgi:hypothetical protein